MTVYQVPAYLDALTIQWVLIGIRIKVMLEQLLQCDGLKHDPPPTDRPDH